MKKSNKQIIKTNIKKQKITFMCVFCFEYLTRIKNHECNESIDAGIIPKNIRNQAMNKFKEAVRKYGKHASKIKYEENKQWIKDLAEIERGS